MTVPEELSGFTMAKSKKSDPTGQPIRPALYWLGGVLATRAADVPRGVALELAINVPASKIAARGAPSAVHGPTDERRGLRNHRACVVTQNVDYERQTAHFAGIVQGVGFRYTAQRIAREFEVAGYVQNLPDGQVLLVAEGTTSQIDQLLNQIQLAMDRYIQRIEVTHGECIGEFEGFEIRY